MKIIITQFILLISAVLFSQVNFEFQYEIPYPTDDSNLCNIQMFDVDNDDILDIALFFEDSNDDLLLRCYQTNGDFICEKTIFGGGFDSEMGWIHEFDNELIVIGAFTEEYEIMTKVCNFQTGSVIDSLIIDETYQWNLFPYEIKDLKAFSHNNEAIILLGFENISGVIIYETKTIRISFDGSLSFEQIYDDIGEEIIDIPEAEELLITGFHYGSDEILSNLTRYLKFISKTDYSTITDLIESSGSSSYPDNYTSNWPYQFEIISRNDNNYSEYGWMFQNIILNNEVHSIEFINYEPNSSNQIWNLILTESNYSEVLATTCVEVNNLPNCVMYFRGDSLEIRDRTNGNIIHKQLTTIIPTDIFRNSLNELLFFENDAINNLIKINKLEAEIYVNAGDENLPASQLVLSNFPNPFNPSTTIEFSIKSDSRVELSIYNVKGQKIKILVNNELNQGAHSIIWKGDDEFNKPLSSGIYLYKLNINGKTDIVNKCLLLK